MKKYLIYGLMVLSLACTSCEKFLDVQPQSQVPTKNLFQQEEGFEDALMGCYVRMTSDNLYGRFLTLEGLDFMAQYYSSAPNSSRQGALREFNYKTASVEAQLKETYNDFYNAILHANEVIEHINQPEAEKVVKSELKRKVLKGEALALRAFLHFDIQRLFGQLPQGGTIQVSLPYSEVTGVEARPLYGFKEYMDKVLKDLSEAEQLLAEDPAVTHNLGKHVHDDVEDKFYHYRRFRLNYFAVKALQARVYLYLGDKEKAYAAAKDVISRKDEKGETYFNLAGDKDIEDGNFALPSETIFGLSSNQLDDSKYLNLFYTTQPDLYMRFSSERKQEMFVGRNTASNNRFGRLWGQVTSVTGVPFIYYKKYVQEGNGYDAFLKMQNRWLYPLIRLSEVYLIMMESSNDLDEINRLFKTYMVARNEQPDPFADKQEVLTEVLNEYRREFMAEGQMFFTYKRLGTKLMQWRLEPVTEAQYIVPVPTSETTK